LRAREKRASFSEDRTPSSIVTIREVDMRAVIPTLTLAIAAACQSPPPPLTEPQKQAVADSARAAVLTLLDRGTARDGDGYAAQLSTDPDAKYAEAGNLSGGAADLGKEITASKQAVDSIAQGLDGWFPAVLGSDAVAFTAPYHFTIALRGQPQALVGTGILSGVVQRRQGAWRLIQYHESYAKQDELLARFASAMNTGAPAKK
jgi:hypothetical protein